jgi:hypothetical protein
MRPRSVDVNHHVFGIGRGAAQAASQHVDAAAQGETSRRSSSSSSAKARRASVVGSSAAPTIRGQGVLITGVHAGADQPTRQP